MGNTKLLPLHHRFVRDTANIVAVAIAFSFLACTMWHSVYTDCNECAEYERFAGCWVHPDGIQQGMLVIDSPTVSCRRSGEEDLVNCTRVESDYATPLPEIALPDLGGEEFGDEEETEGNFSGWVIEEGVAVVSSSWPTPGGGMEEPTLELLLQVNAGGEETLSIRRQFSRHEETVLNRCIP